MANPQIHFFKFIPSGLKFNLSIPKSFLTKLEGWRGKKAILRRGSHKWAVHIDEGGVFGDGWKKFVIENGVEDFDIIVFKHQGNMVFDIFVFDSSTCERHYPNLPDDVEVSPPDSDSHKRSKMLNKRKRADFSSQSKDDSRLDDNQYCFVTIITPYNINTSRVHVPMKFARTNGLIFKTRHTQMVIVDEAKRTWAATLDNKPRQIHITGCCNLMIEHDLKVRDTCRFELVKAGEVPVFNFYNLGKKPMINNQTQVSKQTDSTAKETGSSTRNYFICTLKAYSRDRSTLYLPLEFSIANDLRTGEMILLDDKNRSWKVKVNKHGGNRFYVGRGFRGFWVANGLMEGDVYKFELANNHKDDPRIANFSYLGKKPVKNHIQETTTSSIKKAIGSTLLNKEKCKPPIMNENFDSTPSGIEDRPYYIGEVKSYYIEQSMLYLPSNFVVENGLINKEKMILKNEDERSWTVGLNHVGNCCHIRQGLKDFYGANGLKKGDHFKLELISNGEIPVVNFYVQKVH